MICMFHCHTHGNVFVEYVGDRCPECKKNEEKLRWPLHCPKHGTIPVAGHHTSCPECKKEDKMSDIEKTLAERGARYGDFTDHARLAQALQEVMHGRQEPYARGGWGRLSSDKKQALTVIADKIARILSGDPEYTDNWHDIAGYAKLAEDRCRDTQTPDMFEVGRYDLTTAERCNAARAKHMASVAIDMRNTDEKGYENGN